MTTTPAPTEPREYGGGLQFATQAFGSYSSAHTLNELYRHERVHGDTTYAYPISGDYRLTYRR